MNTIYDKILTPHWLPRLLGAKKATLAISSAGLILKRRNAEPRKVPIENLTRETAWHRGRLFSELVLQTDRGAQRLKGLRASEVAGFFDWLRDCRHWLQDDQKLAPAVRRCAEEIDKLLNAGYLRQSRYRKAKALARDMLHQFRAVPTAHCLDPAVHSDFLLIQQIAHWTDPDVEAFRGQYVNRLKARFAAYFDQVENNPCANTPKTDAKSATTPCSASTASRSVSIRTATHGYPCARPAAQTWCNAEGLTVNSGGAKITAAKTKALANTRNDIFLLRRKRGEA